MTTVRILLFGPAKSLARQEAIPLSLGDGQATLSVVRRALGDACPELRHVPPTWRWAVNQVFVSGEATIQQGDEIALIPPVSGG